MNPWSRTGEAEYRELALRAHDLLADVPLHDAWRVSLPGEHRRCTMSEVRAAAEAARRAEFLGFPARGLFALRGRLGAVFRWDREVAPGSWSLRPRLTEEDHRASLVSPGTKDGPFSVVYVFEKEALSEVRNATIQAYLAWAIRRVAGGHELIWAIYALPVGPWSGPYLALIEPFRRFIVYPALLTALHRAWIGQA